MPILIRINHHPIDSKNELPVCNIYDLEPHLQKDTNFDPFGYDYMMYTIRNKCEELPDMDYDDGIHFIYFYTGGSKGGCKEIKSMI